jgi:hypothetical protein
MAAVPFKETSMPLQIQKYGGMRCSSSQHDSFIGVKQQGSPKNCYSGDSRSPSPESQTCATDLLQEINIHERQGIHGAGTPLGIAGLEGNKALVQQIAILANRLL